MSETYPKETLKEALLFELKNFFWPDGFLVRFDKTQDRVNKMGRNNPDLCELMMGCVYEANYIEHGGPGPEIWKMYHRLDNDRDQNALLDDLYYGRMLIKDFSQ
jgi:hypothetical protein